MSLNVSSQVRAIIVALLISLASISAYAYASPALAAAQEAGTAPGALPSLAAAAGALDSRADRLETDPFARTELFFGSERPGLPEVSDAEFKQFLDESVTPRFPDGLTVLKGFGQFRESSGVIIQESSFVLILLYPRESAKESSAKIEALRAEYLDRFGQESVLRVDDPRAVRVSF